MSPLLQRQIHNSTPIQLQEVDYEKIDASLERPRGAQNYPGSRQISNIVLPPRAERVNSRIANAIQSSLSILDLKEDWDEEGSPGYEEATWRRAAEFVKDVASAFHRRSGAWVDPPRILPGPDGSIDIHWKTSKRELLINIPDDREEPADYYGCGDPTDTIKGKLDTSLPNEWILMWLKR
jgi:hypothetical protein